LSILKKLIKNPDGDSIRPNVKYVERFKRAEQEARENKRGLWEQNNRR
jgi:endonuclease YncB( thermonuclease family)